jgi:hypothetical protein
MLDLAIRRGMNIAAIAFAAIFLMVGIAEAQVGTTVTKTGPNGKTLRLKMDGAESAKRYCDDRPNLTR